MAKGWKKHELDVELAGRLYREGATLPELADHFGIPLVSLWRYLVSAGVDMRSATQSRELRGGYKHSDEVRARISATAKAQNRTMPSTKGRTWDPEQRRKQMEIRRSPEFSEKMAATKRGAKSHLWRGGISPESELLLHGHAWKRRRKECYARDNWTCQDCEVKCGGKVGIQAHHIIARRLGGGDELSNLVTLCRSCHRKREHRYSDALIA